MNERKKFSIQEAVQREVQEWVKQNYEALGEIRVSVVCNADESFTVVFHGDFCSPYKKKSAEYRWRQIVTYWVNIGRNTITDQFRAIGWRGISIFISNSDKSPWMRRFTIRNPNGARASRVVQLCEVSS